LATQFAKTFAEILPGIFRWEVFSPDHKVELSSHAVVVSGRAYCFDPIPLAADAIDELARMGKPTAIVLTNENHIRASGEWQDRWQVPVWASVEISVTMRGVTRFSNSESRWFDWELNPLAGGPGGDIAFRLEGYSLMVMGDAVINLPRRQLELLPDKYCRDPIALRQSLRRLVKEPFDRLLVAHGQPVLEGASSKVAALL
jgi:hypothetical protein